VNLDDLAEQAAPHLATLVHPGDDQTPAFPINLPMFQPAVLPEGLAAEEAEELGLPSLDFGKLFLQALFHMLTTELGVTMVDTAELADLKTAAAAQEPKRTAQIALHCNCGTKLARLAVTDFDTQNPRVNGPALIKAMTAMSPDCGQGHKA
jgi:hypothetical protein